MKFYNLLIKYRLWIGVVLIGLGVYVNYSAGFWPAFPLYLVGLILILGHFFFGPLRLIHHLPNLRCRFAGAPPSCLGDP